MFCFVYKNAFSPKYDLFYGRINKILGPLLRTENIKNNKI